MVRAPEIVPDAVSVVLRTSMTWAARSVRSSSQSPSTDSRELASNASGRARRTSLAPPRAVRRPGRSHPPEADPGLGGRARFADEQDVAIGAITDPTVSANRPLRAVWIAPLGGRRRTVGFSRSSKAAPPARWCTTLSRSTRTGASSTSSGRRCRLRCVVGEVARLRCSVFEDRGDELALRSSAGAHSWSSAARRASRWSRCRVASAATRRGPRRACVGQREQLVVQRSDRARRASASGGESAPSTSPPAIAEQQVRRLPRTPCRRPARRRTEIDSA